MLEQVGGADLRRRDVFLIAGFEPRQRLIGGDAGRGAGGEGVPRAQYRRRRDAGCGQRQETTAVRQSICSQRSACNAHGKCPLGSYASVRIQFQRRFATPC